VSISTLCCHKRSWFIRCSLVFKTSNGWTTNVAATPAVNPAAVSTREGESVEVPVPSIGGTTRGMAVMVGCASHVEKENQAIGANSEEIR
jgi:hypothetical protein